MLATYPDIYAAQRHRVQAVEPPSWDIIAPPFTACGVSNERYCVPLAEIEALYGDLAGTVFIDSARNRRFAADPRRTTLL